MKKSEILAILGCSVKSYRVFKSPIEARQWLEVMVNNINYRELKKILDSLLSIEPINEETILLIFDSNTVID